MKRFNPTTLSARIADIRPILRVSRTGTIVLTLILGICPPPQGASYSKINISDTAFESDGELLYPLITAAFKK